VHRDTGELKRETDLCRRLAAALRANYPSLAEEFEELAAAYEAEVGASMGIEATRKIKCGRQG
jgi:hypothetical protein